MTGDQEPTGPPTTLEQRLNVDFALRATGLGIWEYDPNSNQVLWDERCRALFGLAANNRMSYEQAFAYIHPDDVVRVDQAARQVMDPRSDGVFDQTYRTIGVDDGKLRWVRFQGRVDFTATREVERFGGVAQDVTSQMLAQQALENSRQQVLNSFEQAPFAVAVLTGPELTYQMANASYCQLVARTAEQLVNKPLIEAVPEVKEQGFADLLYQVMKTGTSYEAKQAAFQIHHQNQVRTAYFDFTYQPWQENGQTTGVMIVATDVTQQVLGNQQAEYIQQQVLKQFEQSPVAIATISKDRLIFRSANPFYGQLVGRSPEHLVGKPLLEALPELVGQGFDELLTEVITSGDPFIAFEVAVTVTRHEKLETIYVDLTYQPQKSIDGSVESVLVVATEVTRQVKARQKLAETENQLRTIITHLPSATVVFRGRELIVETPSQNFITIIDRGPNVEGKPLGKLMPELESQSFLAILDNVFTTGQSFRAFGTPVTIRQEDGSTTNDFFDLIYTPLFDSHGQTYAILSVATNVTDVVTAYNLLEESEARYRQLSAQLEQQVKERTSQLLVSNEELAVNNEELAEANSLLARSNDNLQTFAYVASHDLQEPLRKIQQFGNLLQLRQGEGKLDAESAVYVERMQVAASRMSTLIRDLLSFSRISTQRSSEEPVSLNEVLGKVLDTLDIAIVEADAQVQVEVLPTLPGDTVQLGQLFQNLLSNALKFRRSAIAPQIRISSQLIAADQLPPAIKPARWTTSYHLIEVADNGIGFDEKYLDRIFQVFQRLHGKSQYAGTGVGLAICEKVVTNHGGAITASSQPGQGATFSVYLPI